MSCKKCDQPHVTWRGKPSCTGHISTGERAGQPCGNPPRKGQRVCNYHGGKARQARAAGERRETERKTHDAARKLIPDLADRTAISNPLETLLELAGEANAFRESLRLLANDLDNQIRYGGTGGSGEQIRAEVTLYRQAMKDLTDILVAIARLDIEKMLARVTLAQAEQALASIRAGMDEAGLTEDQKRQVMASAGRHLRAVAS